MPTVEALGPLYSQTAPAGLIRLEHHLLGMFPSARSGGMYNPVSSLSSGGPSPHRVTSALDLMCDEAAAARIIRYLVSIAEALNLQQVIAWHEIITAQRWAEGIRYYAQPDHSGGNGHAHIHVGLAASRNFDVSWIGGASHPPPPAPPSPELLRLLDALKKEGKVVYLPFENQTHRFWKDQTTGHLHHAWDTGYEDLTAKNLSKVEPFDANRDPLSVHLTPNNTICVGGMARGGTHYLEWRYHGAWGAEIWPKG